MNGIILVTHAPLANSFLQAAEHIYNRGLKQEVLALDVYANTIEMERFLQKNLYNWLFEQLQRQIIEQQKIHKNQQNLNLYTLQNISVEYLIMNDIIGATPFNLAKKLMQNQYLLEQQLSNAFCKLYLDLPTDFKINLNFALCSYLNLPALLKAICYIQEPMSDILQKIQTAELKCQAFNVMH